MRPLFTRKTKGQQVAQLSGISSGLAYLPSMYCCCFVLLIWLATRKYKIKHISLNWRHVSFYHTI